MKKYLFLALFFAACTNKAELKSENTETPTELFKATDLTKPNLFVEGIEAPAFYDGFLYAVNFQKSGTVGKVNPQTGECELFVNLPEGSIGNGIRFNSKGEMLIADYKKHNVLKVNMKTKEISIFANENRMVGNSPNDLAISSTDVIYASAPNWADNTGSLWKIDTEGKVFLLEKNMGTTNGVEVSPKDDFLYVNESVQRKIWKYNLSPKGEISNKKLLIEFADHGFDGMRCDNDGNLYVCRYGAGEVAKISPEGKILQTIKLTGKNVSNITFGGQDGKTCFVTLQDRGNIEIFRVDQAGKFWKAL